MHLLSLPRHFEPAKEKMKKLLFILLWLQLSLGCHKDFTRKVRSRRSGGRGRGGRSNKGEDYMSSCMDAKKMMKNHCAFLPCHDGDTLLPSPLPCSPEYCQCGGFGKHPTPKTCAEGTVFNPKTANCDWPTNNSECTSMPMPYKQKSTSSDLHHH